MKNLIAVLLLFASTSLQAQPFFIDHEPETMTGVFNTLLENDAYEKSDLLPRHPQKAVKGMLVVEESPRQVRFQTGKEGWDILEFDEGEHQTFAYHYDTSGGLKVLRPEKKLALLEQLKSYLP